MKICGRVVDEDGQPAVGVEVRVTPGDATSTTDADGTFVFERSVEEKRCHVIAQKDDWYAGPLLVWPTDTGEPIELTLQRGATLCVRVAGLEEPIAGATIQLRGESVRLRRATSNAEGTANVRGVPPGIYHGWLVPPTGWAMQMVHATVPREPDVVVEVYARLVRGARMSGVVLRRKKPASDAAVTIRHASDPQVFYFARADENGAWNVEARAGTYRITAADDQFSSDEVIVAHDGHTPRSGVELRLATGLLGSVLRKKRGSQAQRDTATIRGIVVDDQRHPVSGVRVGTTIETRGSMTLGSWHTTDARGRFELENLPPGEYTVRVHERDGIPTAAVAQRARTGDQIELVLPVAGTITGRVLCDGVPARTVQLDLSESSTPVSRSAQRALIDGRFTLRHIECRAWRLFLQAPGTRRKCIDVRPENGVTLDLGDIELERGEHISGAVRDATGAPVSGARVWIGHGIHQLLRSSARDVHSYDTTTDDSGNYVFAGIDAHVESWRGPCIWATHIRGMASRILTLPKADTTIDLVLFETGRIEGRLVGGLPRRLVLAVHSDEPEFARMTSTDPGGAFAFEELPHDDYTISVPDYGSNTPITVVAGQTTNAEIHVVNTLVHLTINYTSEHPGPPQLQHANGEPLARMMSSMNMGGTSLNLSADVEPGSYRFSADGITWASVDVPPSPAEQTIDIPEPASTRKA